MTHSLKQLVALFWLLLFNSIVYAAACPTVDFDPSPYSEIWGCPDEPAINSVMIVFNEPNDKAGLITNRGEIILPVKYDSIRPDSYDKLINNAEPSTIQFTYELDHKVGVIDGEGKIISPLAEKNDLAKYDFGDIAITQWTDNKVVITHKASQSSTEYDWVFHISLDGKNLQVLKENRWGMIRLDNAQIRIPIIYSTLNSFENGLAIASLNNRTGAINEDNETIIPFQYKALSRFKSFLNDANYYAVATPVEETSFLLINTNNDIITRVPQSKLTENIVVTDFNENFLAFVNDREECGVLDWQGNVLYQKDIVCQISFNDNSIELIKVNEGSSQSLSYQFDDLD